MALIIMIWTYFSHMVGATALRNSPFGVSDDKPMSLSSMSCSGSEQSLLDCYFSVPSSSCDKYDIAGVVCGGRWSNEQRSRPLMVSYIY